MSLIKIFAFRHGETDWNRERRFQGHTDIPLNALGRSQAEELSQRMAELEPEIILSSDLSRAVETAKIVNQSLRVPILYSEHLRECRIGDPEGLVREESFKIFGEASWERWSSADPDDMDFAFPNGESKREHLQRLTSYIESFCDQSLKYQKIAISTHGGSIRRLVHNCIGAPKTPVPLPNCGLYVMDYDRKSKNWYFHQL